MAVSEEMILAYIDGELDLSGRAEIEAAMAADAGVARRVEAHRRLRGAFGKMLAGAPDPSSAGPRRAAPRRAPRTAPDNVVDLARFRPKPAARDSRAAPRWLPWGAIAVTVLVLALVVRVWLAPPVPPFAVGPAGPMVAQGALAVALNDQLTSSATGAAKPVSIGVSFRSAAGPLCRTFQLGQGEGLAGVACREAQGWVVRAAMASPAPAAAASGRTAGSDIPAPLFYIVQGMIQGRPLDVRAEAAAKAADWRP